MIRLGGLIDAHVHLAAPDVTIGVPIEDFRRIGVVGVVESGSYGVKDFEVAAARWRGQGMPVRVYANVSPFGLRDPRSEWGPPSDDPLSDFQAAGIRPDGVKVRLGQHSGRDDVQDAIRARDAAQALGIRLMVHVTGATCDPDKLLAALRPSDVLTHCFCTAPFSLLDGAGKVRKSAREARGRGVIFDLAHGATGHFDPMVAQAAIAQGFGPDFISTDWANQPHGGRGPDLVTAMRELLELGMSLEDVVTAVTEAPARAYGFAISQPGDESFVEFDDLLLPIRTVSGATP